MRIVIRTDASLLIGTGHVMRSLTLAEKLSESAGLVQFVCRPNKGDLIDFIKLKGFDVLTLPENKDNAHDFSREMSPHASWLGCDWKSDLDHCTAAITGSVDWLIVDHYALDYRWETAMRNKCLKLMCIDDLADRRHDCDLLLDQSLGRNHTDYFGLVPDHAQLLFGPKYALLRPEFSQWRARSLANREAPQLCHLLITMGGIDADNMTGRVLEAIKFSENSTLCSITVVLGSQAPWKSQVQIQANEMPVPTRVLFNVNNMAELMTSCDLIIGAGGSTTWERCCLGVPTILLILAENQRNIAHRMAKSGAAFVIDELDSLSSIIPQVLNKCKEAEILKGLSHSSATICDGSGVERVVRNL